jgi:O-antigen/teichoic acid export membrane protein
VGAGAWTLLGRVVAGITSLGGSALIARMLTPADVGAYALSYSTAMVGGLVGGLGVSQVVVRYAAAARAAGDERAAARTVLRCVALGLAGAVAVAAAYGAFAHDVLGSRLGSAAVPAVLVGALMIVLSVQTLVAECHRGLGDPRSAALFGGPAASALQVAALAAIWFARARIGLDTLVLLVVGVVGVAGAIGLVTLGRHLRRSVPAGPSGSVQPSAAARPSASVQPSVPVQPSAVACSDRGGVIVRMPRRAAGVLRGPGTALEPTLGRMLVTSAPLLASVLLYAAFTQVDLWVLGMARDGADVGVYAVASRVASLVAMPTMVVNSALLPMIAELHVQGRPDELQRMLRLGAVVATVPALAATLVFAGFGGRLLELVFGSAYRDGAAVLVILAAGNAVTAWTGPGAATLAMCGQERLLLLISAVTGGLTVTAIAVVVPSTGPVGAASLAAGGLATQSVGLLVATRMTTGVWAGASLRAAVRAAVRAARPRGAG